MRKDFWKLYDNTVQFWSQRKQRTMTERECLALLYRVVACLLFEARMAVSRLETRMEEAGLKEFPDFEPCAGRYFLLLSRVHLERLRPEELVLLEHCLSGRTQENVEQTVQLVRSTWKNVLALAPERGDELVTLEERLDQSRIFPGKAVLIGLCCASEYDERGMLDPEQERRRRSSAARIAEQMQSICSRTLGAAIFVVRESVHEWTAHTSIIDG